MAVTYEGWGNTNALVKAITKNSRCSILLGDAEKIDFKIHLYIYSVCIHAYKRYRGEEEGGGSESRRSAMLN